MNRAQCIAALTPGFDPYAGHSDTGSFFSKIGHAISHAAKDIGNEAKRGLHDATHPKDFLKDSFSVAKYGYKNIVKPAVMKGLPIVQTVLKDAGPIGMVAGGAIGAMKAGLSGKNLESIAWAAAEGAAPTGIDKAIGAAEALRHGSNVLTTALHQAASAITPGSPEHLGFQSALDVLKASGSKAALGVARRALPTEGAQRAFDAAIGTVSQAVSKNQSLMVRPGAPIARSLGRPRPPISSMHPNLKAVVDSLKRNPSLMATDPMVLANKFSTNHATILDAMKHVGTKQLLPWRSMSPRAMSFILKWHPHAPVSALGHGTNDTAGLDQTGTKYVVVKGDSPWAIAQALSGNGNNWTQMKALNTDKNPTIDKNIWTGEVLNIPVSWQKPVAPVPVPAPPPAVAVQPAPVIPAVIQPVPAQISVSPSILQAKAILVAWGKTDGVGKSMIVDYGTQAADLSTTMGPRDTTQLAAFQNWDNSSFSAGLPVTGQLDPATLLALQTWAENRAEQAIPNATGNVITLPPMIVTAPPQVYNLPNLATVPPGVTPTPSGASPLPAVASTTSTTPTQGVGKMGAAVGGAAIGGVLFGIPGAIIGGIAGAAIA